MEAKTAALDILFADSLEDLESNGHSRDTYAEVFGVRLMGTSHWSELRYAAKEWFRDNLKTNGVYERGLTGMPPL